MTLNIEAKTDLIHYDLEQDVLDLIKEYNFENKVLISSFNHKCIKVFKELDNTLKSLPKYFSIVFDLLGDSTITRFFGIIHFLFNT